jgi:hypothetical protein
VETAAYEQICEAQERSLAHRAHMRVNGWRVAGGVGLILVIVVPTLIVFESPAASHATNGVVVRSGSTPRLGQSVCATDVAQNVNLTSHTHVRLEPSAEIKIVAHDAESDAIALENGTVQCDTTTPSPGVRVTTPLGIAFCTDGEFESSYGAPDVTQAKTTSQFHIKVARGTLAFSNGAGNQFTLGSDDADEGGVLTGTLTSTRTVSLDLCVDGERAPRNYRCLWIGDAPEQGGHLDQEMMRRISTLKAGMRVRLTWISSLSDGGRIVDFDVLPQSVR